MLPSLRSATTHLTPPGIVIVAQGVKGTGRSTGPSRYAPKPLTPCAAPRSGGRGEGGMFVCFRLIATPSSQRMDLDINA